MNEETTLDNKFIPTYGYRILAVCMGSCSILYYVTKYLGITEPHNIMTGVDDIFPLSTWWVSIYLLSYVFWILNFLLVAREGKEEYCKFMTAYLAGEFFSFACFILFPTTLTRPEITGTGFFDWMLQMTYNADMPVNLLPSLHCMDSWLAFRCIWGAKRTPRWYQLTSFVIAILICLSTQFTKQHVLIDVFAGIIVAEAALRLVPESRPGKALAAKLDRMDIAIQRLLHRNK